MALAISLELELDKKEKDWCQRLVLLLSVADEEVAAYHVVPTPADTLVFWALQTVEGTAWKLLVLESARSFRGYKKDRGVEMEGTYHTSPNTHEHRRLAGRMGLLLCQPIQQNLLIWPVVVGCEFAVNFVTCDLRLVPWTLNLEPSVVYKVGGNLQVLSSDIVNRPHALLKTFDPSTRSSEEQMLINWRGMVTRVALSKLWLSVSPDWSSIEESVSKRLMALPRHQGTLDRVTVHVKSNSWYERDNVTKFWNIIPR
jgi:hypothetical protein